MSDLFDCGCGGGQSEYSKGAARRLCGKHEIPGLDAAAEIGRKLADRAIGQRGQYSGAGTKGLLEALELNGTPLANPAKSWLGKLAGGFAGARPNLPNKDDQ